MNMKKTLIAAAVIILSAVQAFAQTPTEIPWYGNKYSMFIHFGLYSHLGGVWDGQPVKRGYSEQIQSHAGIYGDVYSEIADEFNPVHFDADSIVALAKDAGMKSIVITSKHHDGFCMFRTSTTDYNSFDATPAHRDYIAELSEACRRGGIGFGLYYSLIDWHAPCSAHITSHNADFITPEHHRLNLAQVTELVTGYGPISELWFDMGSLTPEQSKDLYDLVRKHQPDCMVSGRLGNGFYDFAVMSDNYVPEASLQTAWQSAASIFGATWGYRSWQKRENVEGKTREKLESLIRVVSRGGNYLLNIGPKGDGSVVPYERTVLEGIGAWLKVNGDAIYSSSPSPFRTLFSWGDITRNGEKLFLILSGKAPEDGRIVLPMKGYRLVRAEGVSKASLRKGELTVIPEPGAWDGDIKVIRLTFNKPVVPDEETVTDTRIANSSYFCQDYYTNSKSVVSYSWNLSPSIKGNPRCISYTESEAGRTILATIDGKETDIRLEGGKMVPMDFKTLKEGKRYLVRTGKSDFDASARETFSLSEPPRWAMSESWIPVEGDHGTIHGRPMETAFIMQEVESPVDQEVLLEIGAGNGAELYVNGESVMKHLNEYRCTFAPELVRVRLTAGRNQLVLRSYNRFEKDYGWMLRVAADQHLLTQEIGCIPTGATTVSISGKNPQSPHQDCRLHNVRICSAATSE